MTAFKTGSYSRLDILAQTMKFFVPVIILAGIVAFMFYKEELDDFTASINFEEKARLDVEVEKIGGNA